MIYTLMNKHAELFDVEMDRGQAEKLTNTRQEHIHLLPVFLTPKKNMGISKRSFNDWWQGRRIPASRTKIKDVLWIINKDRDHQIDLNELAEKALGLSLSDQYWLRPDETYRWEDVNFFTNVFSDDIGNLLISGNWEGGSLSSPDNTSDGVVRKRWKILDGVRYLLKGSYSTVGIPQPQPFREVFASKIAKLLLGESFAVPYHIIIDGDDEQRIYLSACPNFITEQTEYVSFNQINEAYKRPNDVSMYNFVKSFYGEHSHVLDLMLILDYIVLNEDRHFGNFGLIRDTNSGAFIAPAPVFDTGSSLFFDSEAINVKRIATKPFFSQLERQIQLVDTSKYRREITLVKEQFEQVFRDSFEKSPEPPERKKKLVSAVGKQINALI